MRHAHRANSSVPSPARRSSPPPPPHRARHVHQRRRNHSVRTSGCTIEICIPLARGLEVIRFTSAPGDAASRAAALPRPPAVPARLRQREELDNVRTEHRAKGSSAPWPPLATERIDMSRTPAAMAQRHALESATLAGRRRPRQRLALLRHKLRAQTASVPGRATSTLQPPAAEGGPRGNSGP
jgi:hypothetical protein